jgi:opacity protein-like surface antigen
MMMMQKLALALITSTAVMASATYANIATGYYVGVHGGYGATTAKTTGILATTTDGFPPGTSVPGSTDIGGSAPNLGLMGGYGWVTGCMYYGGELAYTFEPVKINDTDGQNAPNGGIFDKAVLKRSGYFHAGLRGGYLFTPNTMFYIRLGVNFSKWNLNDSLNNGFSTIFPASGSKNRLTVTPGLGLETAIHQHVYLRVEYMYEFGPSVSARNSNTPLGSTTMSNIRSQSGKVGLSYKF